MWGSNVDLTEAHDGNDQNHSTQAHYETSQHDSKEEIHDADLCTENGTVFRIILPNGPHSTTTEPHNNHVPAGAGGRSEAPRSSINDALTLPP
jgi:hypothetical protein